MFPEIIFSHAIGLYEIFKPKGHTRDQFLLMYFYANYRHELFHYQTERYATKLELITHQPHYRSLDMIRDQVKNTEDWLEEALAEACVLNSILVSNRSKMHINLIREVYKFDLQSMPSGYRDYACNKFGGPAKAQLLFASQIKEMKIIPGFTLPKLFTVEGEFSSNDFSVPLYLVSGFSKILRVR
jgi:hypothetical protein